MAEYQKIWERNAAKRNDRPSPVLVLDEFASDITNFAHQQVQGLVLRGFITNLGQEWRVVVRSANAGGKEQNTLDRYEQILLRAHVPVNNYPVLLDIYEDNLVSCENEAKFRTALRQFAETPAPLQTIEYIQQLTLQFA